MKKVRKKGTGYFFGIRRRLPLPADKKWKKMQPVPIFYIFQTAHLEKVACPLFYYKKEETG